MHSAHTVPDVDLERAYTDALNALHKPFNFDDVSGLVTTWSRSFSSLAIVLDFPSVDGKGTSWGLSDQEWFRLLGRFWLRFDDVEQRLDDLLDSPFYDLADRRYYDHTLGLSKREISGRERWRKDCIAAMMTASEQGAYEALPDELTLYRGCYQSNRMGLSWTLDHDAAKDPQRLHALSGEGNALILTAIASKRDILAVKGAEIITWNPRVVSEKIIDVGVPA